LARILLIDDDELVRATLSAALRAHGYETDLAGDGRDVMSRFQEGHFDLLVTDLIMPGQDGLDTIAQVRRAHPDLPIIAISGGGRHTNRDFLQVAEALGATRTLNKPFVPSQLVGLVRELLGESEPQSDTPPGPDSE
jgi:CheY-like chemotaxis protein